MSLMGWVMELGFEIEQIFKNIDFFVLVVVGVVGEGEEGVEGVDKFKVLSLVVQ